MSRFDAKFKHGRMRLPEGQLPRKNPPPAEASGVSGIAAGGGLQRLFGPALLQHQGVRGVALSISRQRFKSS